MSPESVSFSEADADSAPAPAPPHLHEPTAAQSNDFARHSAGEALESKLAEANDRVLRLHAELENTRKRMQRDHSDALKYAALPLIRDLLPALDNLRRAIEAAKGDQASGGLVDGVKLVLQQIETVFQQHGCTPIPALGQPFDPNFHSALSQTPSAEHPPMTILYEAAVGYQLYDRVVRPSHVIVSGPPAEQTP